MGRGRGLPRPRGAITPRRQIAGYALAAALPPVLTLVLTSLRGGLNLTSDVLLFLVAVIVVALTGGFVPAVLAAIIGSLLLNYYFIPPVHQLTIAQANNALALAVFVIVGLLVSWVVDIAARRTKQAARANAESELLTTTAGSVLRGQQGLSALLERIREAFGMDSVTLLEGPSADDGQPAGASAGAAPRHAGRLARGGQPGRARRHPAGRRRRRSAGHRPAVAGPEGPAAARRGPPRARRVRVLRGGGPRPAAADRGGRGGQADRGRRQDAHRAAGRGEPRPAHAARVGQGGGDQPAVSRRELGGGGPRRAAGHGGRVAGPAHPPGGQPAGYEQAAGRRAVPVPAARRAGRDRVPGAGQPGPGRARASPSTSRSRCRRSTSTRPSWNASS